MAAYLIHKYKLERDGWFVPGSDYEASGIWRSILFMKGVFDHGFSTRFMMGSLLNFGMTNGVDSGFGDINFLISIFWTGGNMLL